MRKANLSTRPVKRNLLRRLVFNAVLLMVLAVLVYAVTVNLGQETFPAIVTGELLHVSPPVAGNVVRLHVWNNDHVQRGDLLAELEDETLSARIAAASAELEELEITRTQATSDVSRALRRFAIQEKIAEIRGEIATLEVEIQAADNAIREANAALALRTDALERAQALLAEGAIRITERDQRQLAVNEARGELDAHRALHLRLRTRRDGLSSSIALYEEQLVNLQRAAEELLTELDVQIRQRQGDLQTLQSQQKQMQVRAEADGVVNEVLRREGELATPGDVIMTISTGGELWVEAYVPPDKRSNIHPDDQVTVLVEGFRRLRLSGRIVGMLPVLRPYPTGDPTGLTAPEPQAIFEIRFQDPELSKQQVRPGQRVKVIPRNLRNR